MKNLTKKISIHNAFKEFFILKVSNSRVEGLNTWGHIGYGVRPSERKKGYATQMLKLTLEEAKKKNIRKVQDLGKKRLEDFTQKLYSK